MIRYLTQIVLGLWVLGKSPESEGWMGDGTRIHHDPFHSVMEPKFVKSFNEHVCSLFIYTDPFLWRHIYRSMKGSKRAERTRLKIEKLLTESVTRVNEAFSMAEFYGSGQTIHKGVHFSLLDYIIDDDTRCFSDTEYCDEKVMPMGEMCNEPIVCDNLKHVFCNNLTSLRFYLHAFSAFRNHGAFCLSYAFTYRNMSDFQGIAWVKGYDQSDERSLSHYGYCSLNDEKCQDESLQYYYRNTGVVNFHRLGENFSTSIGANVFIHEIGHSLGSTHDDKVSECNPQGHDLYLMTGKAENILLQRNSDRLSACSSREIGRNLDKVTCWNRKGKVSKDISINTIFGLFFTFLQSYCSSESCKKAQENLTIVMGIILMIMIITSIGLCYCYRVMRKNDRREKMLKRRRLLLLDCEITSMWSVDYGSVIESIGMEEQTEFFKAYNIHDNTRDNSVCEEYLS
ncbi:disintegrin and metalloproteinase domain-containing protein 10 homolog [Lepeophtheirus salmonis]|nr:disintegrin and metalloproteinase domain-containing protein 10 homolog [Lepeophtheirus salmonis]XP_040573127.1 disintegrin and metalloproteinase domain-containing protein 10 homolog [Lepeophtheirus salmonis]